MLSDPDACDCSQNHAPYPLAAPPPSGLPQHYPATQAPVQSAPGEHVHKTTTVRNLVNVKKASLSLKPLPNHPHLLQVSFQFDAIAPCRSAPPSGRPVLS